MTEEGTVNKGLLALRLMLNGLDGAWLRLMMQLAVELGNSCAGEQLNAFSPTLALNERDAFICIPLASAVIDAMPSKLDAATVTVKLALVDPADTLTLAGTEAFALLLEMATPNPVPGAGPVKETVQVADPGELTPDGAQAIELSCSVPATVIDAF